MRWKPFIVCKKLLLYTESLKITISTYQKQYPQLTDASVRPSCADALKLPWLQNAANSDAPIDTGVLGSLQDFSKKNVLST